MNLIRNTSDLKTKKIQVVKKFGVSTKKTIHGLYGVPWLKPKTIKYYDPWLDLWTIDLNVGEGQP